MALLSLLCGSFRSTSAWTAPVRSLGRAGTHGTSSSRYTSRLLSTVGTPATSFDDGVSPFEITTPIYYVNDKPHIGHAYTSTACDVIARFMRLSGREVFFLSGTDEHGQKVEQSAAAKNVDPQAFVDDVSQNFRDLLELMNISNDKFIRTTQEDHKQSVQVRI
jgi:methionyl-tRNA synthetase